MSDHHRDGDREPPDRLETWAKRTGRVLGFAALFLLALYLLFTYVPR